MFFFQCSNRLLVIGFNLLEVFIPVFIEFLVFHDVSLLDFFTFLCLVVYHFLPSSLEVLLLQLLNPVFCHFSLYCKCQINKKWK